MLGETTTRKCCRSSAGGPDRWQLQWMGGGGVHGYGPGTLTPVEWVTPSSYTSYHSYNTLCIIPYILYSIAMRWPLIIRTLSYEWNRLCSLGRRRQTKVTRRRSNALDCRIKTALLLSSVSGTTVSISFFSLTCV